MTTTLHRTLVALLAVVGIAIGIAGAALVVLVTMSFGARQALRLAGERIPGEISVGSIDGSLYSGLDLGDVRYRNDNVDARFESLSVDASWSDVVARRWVLDELAAASGRIDVARGAADAPNGAARPRLPDVLPRVEIRSLAVRDVRVGGLGAPLRIATVIGSMRAGSIALERAVIEMEGATFAAAGEAAVGASRATASLTGSVRLPTDAASASAVAADARSIAFATTLAFDEDAGDGAWRAALDWSRLEWRRPGASSIASPSGRLTVRPGGGDAFDLTVAATVEGEPLPAPAAVTFDGSLSGDAVVVERGEVEIAGAEARLTGAFRLAARSGYVSVDYRGVDPSLIEPRMNGRLSGRLDVALAAEPALRVGGSGRVAGDLDGRPLDGRFAASFADDALSIERAFVSLDGDDVVVDGRLSPGAADLRFSANLPRVGNCIRR